MDGVGTGLPVVVGVDGSRSALAAVRWGAAEASRRGARLRLVTVVGWAPSTQLSYPPIARSAREILLRQARTHLGEAAEAAQEVAPGAEPEGEVLDGYPGPELFAESRAAQLLAVGDRGLGGVAGLMVGSVAFGLGAHAACPVAVVRGRADADAGPVVVGVETSPNSDAALAFAFEEAAARKAPLVAVHTWWDLLIDPVALVQEEEILRQERARLAERVAGWRQKYPDVAVELVVEREQPAAALTAQSRHAQLLVVGSHGHGRVTGLLFGSVGHALVHRADCPVVLVRPETASEGRVPGA